LLPSSLSQKSDVLNKLQVGKWIRHIYIKLLRAQLGG
jgi:hypothetical protein